MARGRGRGRGRDLARASSRGRGRGRGSGRDLTRASSSGRGRGRGSAGGQAPPHLATAADAHADLPVPQWLFDQAWADTISRQQKEQHNPGGADLQCIVSEHKNTLQPSGQARAEPLHVLGQTAPAAAADANVNVSVPSSSYDKAREQTVSGQQEVLKRFDELDLDALW